MAADRGLATGALPIITRHTKRIFDEEEDSSSYVSDNPKSRKNGLTNLPIFSHVNHVLLFPLVRFR